MQSGTFPKKELVELSYLPKAATLSLATMLAKKLFNDPDSQPAISEDMNKNQVELIATASGLVSLVQQLQQSISEVLQVAKHVERQTKTVLFHPFKKN